MSSTAGSIIIILLIESVFLLFSKICDESVCGDQVVSGIVTEPKKESLLKCLDHYGNHTRGFKFP